MKVDVSRQVLWNCDDQLMIFVSQGNVFVSMESPGLEGYLDLGKWFLDDEEQNWK